MNRCIIVPDYNHEESISHGVSKFKMYGIFCLIVNDGSSVVCSQTLTDPVMLELKVTEITAATSILLNDKIDNDELVIIAADRTPVGNSQRVTKLDFPGAKAVFPQGPFILASLLNYPVYTLFCLKQQGKHVIYFDYFNAVLKFPGKNREQAMQKTIQHYAQCLQNYWLKEPLPWFNFFDFWSVINDSE